MSKLIITGVENGKITYVEGEEVVTSVSDIEVRVNELREKISAAKSIDIDTVEKEHTLAKDRIYAEYESSVAELKRSMEIALSEEDRRYELAKANLVTSEDLETMEREEAKLSLILGGLRAQVVEETVTEEVAVEEVSAEGSETEEVVEEAYEPEKSQEIEKVAEEKPRRIIF